MRHSVEYNITSRGENSTMVGEYRSSHSASPVVVDPFGQSRGNAPGQKLKKVVSSVAPQSKNGQSPRTQIKNKAQIQKI